MTSDTSAAASPPGAYHHGDLPRALLDAAAAVIAERGVAGFSLREVARRAGVSHTAPAHHFGDARGLLTALATEAFRHLEAQTSAAIDGIDDPVDALAALGRAYVAVSVQHPGHCAVIFRGDVVDADDADYQLWGDRAFAVLHGTLERLAADHDPDLDVDVAAHLCWSTMQGLVGLYEPMVRMADKDDTTLPPIGDMAEAFARLTTRGLASGDR